jgi:hypothetical protein
MARPSKLTEKQWLEIERRMIEGEGARSLAREFGVSDAAIRQRVSTQVKQVKAIANQIVATERELSALPIASQIYAQTLASKLRSISDNLASAAMHGAATAHRLNALANSEVSKIDDSDVLSMESMEAMKGVSALTRLANDSSNIALNLLAANKERVKQMDDAETPPKRRTLADFYADTAKP